MRRLRFIIINLILLLSSGMAHEVQENTAKVTLRHNTLSLALSIHPSQWSKKFTVEKFDDAILKETKLLINQKSIALKLRKIEKKSKHYSVLFVSSSAIDSKIKEVSLALPKELGNIVVTVVQANTKFMHQGKAIEFVLD